MAKPLKKDKTSVMGPPTKYNQAIVDKANDYIENYTKYGDEIPSVAGLTEVIDISAETLNVWRKQESKKDISETLIKLKLKQERVLLNKGLNNTFNAAITKLALCNHGYSDKPTDQAQSKITVNVNRGNVTIESGSEKLTIDTDTVIEHEPE